MLKVDWCYFSSSFFPCQLDLLWNLRSWCTESSIFCLECVEFVKFCGVLSCSDAEFSWCKFRFFGELELRRCVTGGSIVPKLYLLPSWECGVCVIILALTFAVVAVLTELQARCCTYIFEEGIRIRWQVKGDWRGCRYSGSSTCGGITEM